jgi:hypothetical protein
MRRGVPADLPRFEELDYAGVPLYNENGYRLAGRFLLQGPEYQFQVRFWGDSARFVRETQFHPSQKVLEEAGDAVLFTAQACGLRPVARWVLSFGGEAEVLEPVELREMVAEAFRAGAGRYGEAAQ